MPKKLVKYRKTQNLTLKLRLYPTPEQKEYLERQGRNE